MAIDTPGVMLTTVTDPQGNQMVITFQGGFETERRIQGGALLQDIITCYNGNKTACDKTAVKFPITELTAFGRLPNGLENEQDTFFDRNSGLQTEIDEYDFGSNAPGALLRKTLISYDASLNNNITSKPGSVTVCSPPGTDTACNGSGTKVAQTTFNYDEGTLATAVAVQHISVSGSRGNLTSVHRWLSSTGGTVKTGFTFDDAGQIQTATDGNGNITSFGYGCSDSFLNQITRPATAVNHISSLTPDCNTGLTLNTTDENGQITSFSYDEIKRPTKVVFPDNGQTTISYPNANQNIVQHTIDSARSTYSTSLIDGYGRISRTAVANGESTPYDQQDFCYNSNGQLGFKSYPYQGTSPVFNGAKVCSGAGDSFTYDALGRTTQVTHADGSASTVGYGGTTGGRASQFTDEGNGSSQVSRILQRDALGRLAAVCELYPSTAPPLQGNGGSPAACGLDIPGTGFLTTYGYDTLDNLTSVSQAGISSRTYAYDSLSQQLCSAIPEIGGTASCPNPDTGAYTNGTIRYSYDANGNLASKQAPAPNQNGTSTVTTTYKYDGLNRLTQKSYSDSTLPVYFEYDTNSGWAVSQTNLIGRLAGESVGSGCGTTGCNAEIFGYDAMGRIVLDNPCLPHNCPSTGLSVSYGYDLLGDLTSATNGAGVTLNYSHNIAGRLIGITSSLRDANHPSTLLSALSYSPSQVTGTLGNQVVETTTFNQRGMLTSYLANAPNGTPGTGSVTISGTLQTYQQQTQAGTPANVTMTLGGSDGAITVQICVPNLHGGQTCHFQAAKDGGAISLTVTAGGNSVSSSANYSASSSPSSIATDLYNNFPSNSLVTMSNPNGSSSFTFQTIAVGASTNNTTFSATIASSCKPTSCSGGQTTWGPGGWTMTPSQGNFSGGTDPVYQPAYDNGSTTITVNSYPDSYSWSGSATTAASIAQGLCSKINGDTAAFATASTNGIAGQCPLGSATVSLASRNDGQNYTLAASSSSVVNSFSVSCPGFADCKTASLTGGGSPAYSFTLGPAPDGQITSANDFVNGNLKFTYDQFNRLSSTNKNSGQQTFTYDYDVLGNRWHQRPNQGPAPQYVFDNNNHIVGSGVSYDAPGNVANDGLGNSFVWDAEGRLIQVQQGGTVIATYIYGADGSRVEGPNGDYLYDLGGHMITQFGLNGGWNFGEIYAGGRHLATYSDNTTNFFHSDWLGTKRVMTALNGTVSETCAGFPFADGVTCTGPDWNYNRFTDDIHDPETNLEHTLFRQYSGTQGRWLTPDPYAASASLADPQSWNRYSYVENNATNAFDPLGLYCPTYRPAWAHIVCSPGNLSNGFQADSWDNMPGIGGFSFGVDFGGIPSPSSVNCFAPGSCPINMPLPTLGQAIQDWLAGMPWNNPCIQQPWMSDACGFAQNFQNLMPSRYVDLGCDFTLDGIQYDPSCGTGFLDTPFARNWIAAHNKECGRLEAAAYDAHQAWDKEGPETFGEDFLFGMLGDCAVHACMGGPAVILGSGAHAIFNSIKASKVDNAAQRAFREQCEGAMMTAPKANYVAYWP